MGLRLVRRRQRGFRDRRRPSRLACHPGADDFWMPSFIHAEYHSISAVADGEAHFPGNMCNLARAARIKSDKHTVNILSMKLLFTFLFLSMTLFPRAALAKSAVTDYPATYAGGSLPLNHNKVHAALGKDEVIFMQ